jgi:hypothetical protein
MCSRCERVRRGGEGATLARHSGQNSFSGVSAPMQLRRPESVELSPSLV